MIARDVYRLMKSTPVLINELPFQYSNCWGHEVTELYCDNGRLHIFTKEDIGNAPTPAVSVGKVLDVLPETAEREIILKFKARSTFDAGEECRLFHAITELVDVTGLYRSLAVHRITPDGDTLKIEVEVEVSI